MIATIVTIMERVVIPTEDTDRNKKELRETGVYFPDTNEGFSDLTPCATCSLSATTTLIAISKSQPPKSTAASKSKSSRQAEHIFL